jgi:hypothetical protein
MRLWRDREILELNASSDFNEGIHIAMYCYPFSVRNSRVQNDTFDAQNTAPQPQDSPPHICQTLTEQFA